jgi:hypothetical protein
MFLSVPFSVCGFQLSLLLASGFSRKIRPFFVGHVLRPRTLCSFDVRDLIDAALMPAARECRLQPERQDFIGQRVGDDARSDGEDVRIVMLPRQSGRIKIVAQRGADPWNLVRGHLFSLAASSDDDPPLGAPLGHLPRDVGTDRGVIGHGIAVGASIVHGVTQLLEYADEVLLQRKPSMIRADRDAHMMAIIQGGCWLNR